MILVRTTYTELERKQRDQYSTRSFFLVEVDINRQNKWNMASLMKAARFDPTTTTIKLQEIPIPKPKHDEILVRTISSGLCHSDLVCR